MGVHQVPGPERTGIEIHGHLRPLPVVDGSRVGSPYDDVACVCLSITCVAGEVRDDPPPAGRVAVRNVLRDDEGRPESPVRDRVFTAEDHPSGGNVAPVDAGIEVDDGLRTACVVDHQGKVPVKARIHLVRQSADGPCDSDTRQRADLKRPGPRRTTGAVYRCPVDAVD